MITMGAIRTVGVDLSAEPDRTAICAVNWTSGAASVEPPIRPADDAAVLAACASADRVGIDCPFGWPEPFLAAVSAHAAGQPWPGRHRSTDPDCRRELRYRATDYRVREITGSWPLSVSTDRIGVAAMRCASLLDSLAAQGAPVDRRGSGRVVEVYPAAALHVWRLLRPGYKHERLPEHSYRAGLIVQAQPERAGVLLNDVTGGTPQRFVWLAGHTAFAAPTAGCQWPSVEPFGGGSSYGPLGARLLAHPRADSGSSGRCER